MIPTFLFVSHYPVFISADIDDEDASTSVNEGVVDLGNHPCIGVASEGDAAIPLRRFSIATTDMARAVATQVCACVWYVRV